MVGDVGEMSAWVRKVGERVGWVRGGLRAGVRGVY